MRALVTAGGTSEPIDDVRVVTNLSTGRFGAAIARALAARGVEVTLLAGRALASHPEWVPPTVRVVRFGSFVDLDRVLTDALETPPDLLLMAAAVSDYAPVPVDGKIRSDQDELAIVLRKNPKLLAGLRARCGLGTFLVGFKLLSNVTPQALFDAAFRQVRENRLNLCVANDLREFAGDRHPVTLVTPEGGALRRDGPRDDVAASLVDFVLRRADVRWHRSAPSGRSVPRDGGWTDAAALLGVAIDGGLLPGTDGNVSHRTVGGLWTTPRQVHKARLTPDDLVFAEVDPAERAVRWSGARKPSIDTAVHASLYRQVPRLAGLVHFHDALVFPTAATSFPYPCGAVEEAEEIVHVLARAAWEGAWDGGGFAVRLVDHGYLVGTDDAQHLAASWAEVRDGYRAHLAGVGVSAERTHSLVLQPLFDGGRIVGVSARVDAGGRPAWSTWVHPSHRGNGLGDRIAEILADERRHVVVGDRCEVVDWYAERAFRVIARDGAFAVLEPPTCREDLVPAASVCLLDAVTRRVLIGRRTSPRWQGYWAFPGGRVEPGESALAAAVRELTEETGIPLDDPRPIRERTVYVGTPGTRSVPVDPGARSVPMDLAFAVTNFVIPVVAAVPARPTAELDATWVPLAETAQLRPMAAGTRRVLRGLASVAFPAEPR